MRTDGAPGRGLQLVLLLGEASSTLDLPRAGTLSIGRDESSDLRIPEPSVSRQHAVLHLGAQLLLEDLGSVNGTMIRDRPGPADAAETLNVRHLIGRKAELSVGDTLLFGTACVVVRHAPKAEPSSLTAASEELVIRDPAMLAIYAQAALAAPAPISVLLLGETGVGKEVLARAIHLRSQRAKGPFQAVNCAALADTLLESELFGHEKGAFTGAVQARAGLFEVANGGTVLLDEIGELSLTAQAKLLRVLEERVVVRLGSTRSRELDVRVLAATNRDLEADCRAGRFRQDLYYRLNGLALTVPPLRERPLELEALAGRFLASACRLLERSAVPRLSAEVLDCLRSYRWPGNARELRQCMERAAVLCQGATVLLEHLPSSVAGVPRERAQPLPADLPGEIRSLERTRIVEALERSGGSQSAAARVLGISRRTLISRIEEYGLPRPRKHGG